MPKFQALVTIDTDTTDHAEQVLAERLGYDEDYGFDYTVQPSAVITTAQLADLTELLDVAGRAALGDSNDEEIAAWRSAAEYAAELLNLPTA